jgi:alpha-amylase/alpha-mannosidase (GH57 family)
VSHRHICVHGHFYQPPRENPWTGSVDREGSAAPFHDWNARIAEECYGPITLGVRAGSDGLTIAYDETLKRLSYDFGPTLLSWLERERPALLERIRAADAETQTAIAQPYFHNILPLEARRDKETLVRWGLAEFRHRFGRAAKGMWLPETAVDAETLEVLAGEGVEFTILDPKQGEAVRDLGSASWVKLDAEHIDPKMPYLWVSPVDPSKKLVIFFYHHRLSQGIVTGETTASAEHFADAARARLMPGDAAQLVHVVSDGEFYGHHHPGAERVLALTLDLLEADGIPAIDPSSFLALFPPPHEVRIRDNTAWSCEHGLGRWEKDCGCRSTHLPEWNQNWRAGMRDAFTKLAHRLDAFYEDDASRFFADPWKVRDESVALWLSPGDEGATAFLKAHAKRPLLAEEEKRALELLMMQRERLAMFTSCGWFFDDISGVEAVLCLTRAARALDLAKLLGEDAEEGFVERLSACRSNLPRFENGAKVWRTLVSSARVGLARAAAHAALLDHLDLPAPEPRLLSWKVGPAFRASVAGLAGRERTLSIRPVLAGRLETRESAEFHVVVHRADRLDFAVWLAPRKEPLDPALIGDQFLRLSDDEFRAAMDERFGASIYGLDAVLNDERSEVVKALSAAGALGAARSAYLKRWVSVVSALRRGGKEDDAVLQLLSESAAHSFNAQELPWSSELEDRLHAHMEAVVAAPEDAAAVSRALRWLDALWDAGLLAGTWRLRDAQGRWAAALEGRGPSAALDACRAVGARLGLADLSTETSQ